MDPDPVTKLLVEAHKRLERTGMIEVDLKAGFHQLPITNSSFSTNLISTFSSPLPGIHAFACPNCARYKLKLAELQARLIELEPERANTQQETQSSHIPSKE